MNSNTPDMMAVNNLLSSVASNPPATSNHGQYSPFHNLFMSAVAEVLGKKGDDQLENRMNFASVVTSNIPSPSPGSGLPPSSLHDVDSDLALQAKAPGFKPTRSISPQQFHSDIDLNRAPGYKGGINLSTQFTNDMDLSRAPGYRACVPSPGMSPRSNTSTPSGTSPRGRPATPGEHPQTSMSASSISSQKDEYSTPNQPMTLPKIGSSLNPNAPDFTARSMPPSGSPMPEGRSMPGFPPGQPFPNSPASSNIQQLYHHQNLKAAGLLNHSLFAGGIVPPSSFIPPNNMPGPVPDMTHAGSSVNMNLLQRLTSPGGAAGPGPLSGQMMPRSYSPLHPPPTPPSAMPLAGMPRGKFSAYYKCFWV